MEAFLPEFMHLEARCDLRLASGGATKCVPLNVERKLSSATLLARLRAVQVTLVLYWYLRKMLSHLLPNVSK